VEAVLIHKHRARLSPRVNPGPSQFVALRSASKARRYRFLGQRFSRAASSNRIERAPYSMDFTIPYTFYPSVLPHGLEWGLFALAVLGALVTSFGVARVKRPWVGLLLFVPILLGLLIATVVCSIVITFFLHDV
jgi:hypothetical protein